MSSYLEKTIKLKNPVVGLAVGRNILEGELICVGCMKHNLMKSILPLENDIVTKKVHSTHITAISMSNTSAGRKDVLVTVDDKNNVILWNPIVGTVIRGFQLPGPRVHTLCVYHGIAKLQPGFEDDNVLSHLIVGLDDGTIAIWDLNTDKCIKRVIAHGAPIQDIKLGYIDEIIKVPDPRPVMPAQQISFSQRMFSFLLGSAMNEEDNNMNTNQVTPLNIDMNTTDADLLSPISPLSNSSGARTDMEPAFSDESSAGESGFASATAVETRNADMIMDLESQSVPFDNNRFIEKVVKTPVIVSGALDRCARTWNLESLTVRRIFRHKSMITAVNLSHPLISEAAQSMRPIRPMVVTGGSGGSLRLWDELTGTLLHKFKGHTEYVFSLSFWIDKEVLLVSGGGDHSLRVWDCVSGECMGLLRGHKNSVTGVEVCEFRDAYSSQIGSSSTLQALRIAPAPTGSSLGSGGAASPIGLLENDPMASPPSTSRAVIVSSSLDGTVRRWDLQKLIDSYYRSVLKCGCFTVDHSQGHRNGFGVNLPKHEYEKKPWAGALTIPLAPFWPKIKHYNANINQAKAYPGLGSEKLPKSEDVWKAPLPLDEDGTMTCLFTSEEDKVKVIRELGMGVDFEDAAIIAREEKKRAELEEQERLLAIRKQYRPLEVGCKVEAAYGGGDEWYPGSISVDHGNGKYDITYDDGDAESNVLESNIRSTELQPDNNDINNNIRSGTPQLRPLEEGCTCEALYGGGDDYYPGSISAVNEDGTFNILYDDGDVEEFVAESMIRSTEYLSEPEPEPVELVDDEAKLTEDIDTGGANTDAHEADDKDVEANSESKKDSEIDHNLDLLNELLDDDTDDEENKDNTNTPKDDLNTIDGGKAKEKDGDDFDPDPAIDDGMNPDLMCPSLYTRMTRLSVGMQEAEDEIALDFGAGDLPLNPGIKESYDRRMDRPTVVQHLIKGVDALSAIVVDSALGIRSRDTDHPLAADLKGLGDASQSSAISGLRLSGDHLEKAIASAREAVTARLNEKVDAIAREVHGEDANKPPVDMEDLYPSTKELVKQAVSATAVHMSFMGAREKALKHERREVAKEGMLHVLSSKTGETMVNAMSQELLKFMVGPNHVEPLGKREKSVASKIKEQVEDIEDNLFSVVNEDECIIAALDAKDPSKKKSSIDIGYKSESWRGGLIPRINIPKLETPRAEIDTSIFINEKEKQRLKEEEEKRLAAEAEAAGAEVEVAHRASISQHMIGVASGNIQMRSRRLITGDESETIAEGTTEGVVETIAEGTTEGTTEGNTEGTTEGATEGATEGVVEIIAEGTTEAATKVATNSKDKNNGNILNDATLDEVVDGNASTLTTESSPAIEADEASVPAAATTDSAVDSATTAIEDNVSDAVLAEGSVADAEQELNKLLAGDSVGGGDSDDFDLGDVYPDDTGEIRGPEVIGKKED